MKIISPAFSHIGNIPPKFTCQGEDINPELRIVDFPEGTKCFALIVDDPDAPIKTWVHWVMYNIPIQDRIEEDRSYGVLGMNDFGRLRYGGPCPPSGSHRYFFKLYALDEFLDLEEGATKEELEKGMEGHILAYAELIGLYEKI